MTPVEEDSPGTILSLHSKSKPPLTPGLPDALRACQVNGNANGIRHGVTTHACVHGIRGQKCELREAAWSFFTRRHEQHAGGVSTVPPGLSLQELGELHRRQDAFHRVRDAKGLASLGVAMMKLMLHIGDVSHR